MTTNNHSSLKDKYEWQTLAKNKINEFMKSDSKHGLIKAFCGCGKTSIEVWTMLEHTKRISILSLSSLNLFDQYKTEYFDNKIDNYQFEVFFVCSDRNATTDEKEIKDFLNNNSGRKKNNRMFVSLFPCAHKRFKKNSRYI